MVHQPDFDSDHATILHKKSASLGSPVQVKIPTELLERSKDWWFARLSESDKIQLVADYLSSLSLFLDQRAGDPRHE